MSAYDHTMRAFRHVWALEKEEAERLSSFSARR